MKSDKLNEIIRLCQSGDKGAFVVLLNEFGPRLYRYFLRISRSTQDAQDLLQDLFVKLLENIKGYRHENRFENWLFRVAANLARDRARRKNKTVSLHAIQDDQADRISIIESNVPSPSSHLQKREQRDKLANALEQLAPQERKMILLRHYGNLSFKELAEHFDIPPGTALSKVHRGLKKLKRMLHNGSP